MRKNCEISPRFLRSSTVQSTDTQRVKIFLEKNFVLKVGPDRAGGTPG